MCSEIANMIVKGIDQVRHEADKSTIFDASLYFSNVTIGNTLDTIKKFLINFKNEMYCEKGKQPGFFVTHFYSKARAKDALSYIKNTPSQFSNCEMVVHKKEIGLMGEVSLEAKLIKKKTRGETDDDGFTNVL